MADAFSNLQDKAADLKDRLTDTAKNVQGKIDQSRRPVADTLHGAASTLHGKAASLEATADYIRSHNTQDMLADVRACVRKYPAQSLIIAATFGILVGRKLKGRSA